MTPNATTLNATTAALPTADELRDRARAALKAVGSAVELGEPGGAGLQASTPVTGDVLFTVTETTSDETDAAIADAAAAFAA